MREGKEESERERGRDESPTSIVISGEGQGVDGM